ncbi:MAG: 50S ribosomal protein L32 [Candidatus Brennerbacteria bacterium RIFOXYC1_FULL_41_11]|uniref:Large ribosomal subunit protein bL32 n=1 Tax=Candidatus Brennerbacteria bacterium RIFOXYD1_FULL_41_16 TaxID=1797529 RepID=A0A1G1XLF3_9BACT|nr:MAG: 50S ribosomal protein L32 [Candidatus Brennerbacteria bacterium RIFOXYB1_FULL_41_13]OGY39756.1 MAG: 50S ribosomal protein L32 [Candidatus Brennerbacteria bacterium RIFOXYC1_FULL_41_11]OGY40801.1 MAG: 50S ribosomal protein L32 [Candidatus Brennerbacteria bacterium RIFOXYD1_FULL_41_16]
MGGTPTRHHTKRRKNAGRSHFALKKPNLVACKQCHALSLPHRVCKACGFYNGKEELDVLKKLDKKAKKRREQLAQQTKGK